MLQKGGQLSRSTSDTRRVTYPMISHERGKDREVLTTSGTFPWSFVTQIFHNGQPSNGDDFNLTKRKPWVSSFLVCSNPPSRKSWYESFNWLNDHNQEFLYSSLSLGVPDTTERRDPLMYYFLLMLFLIIPPWSYEVNTLKIIDKVIFQKLSIFIPSGAPKFTPGF